MIKIPLDPTVLTALSVRKDACEMAMVAYLDNPSPLNFVNVKEEMRHYANFVEDKDLLGTVQESCQFVAKSDI